MNLSGGDEDKRFETGTLEPLEEPTRPIPDPANVGPSTVSVAEDQQTPTVVSVVEEDETPTVVSVADEDEDPTVVSVSAVDDAHGATPAGRLDPMNSIAPSAAPPPMLLERIEPSLARGERLRLDAAHGPVSIGRAERNDLRLYTASASREHAVIAGNEAGAWLLTPVEGRSVSIDGDPTEEPVELEIGMNLVLGGDHLRCVADTPLREESSGGTESSGRISEGPSGRRGRASWIVIGLIAAAGLGLIAYAWLIG